MNTKKKVLLICISGILAMFMFGCSEQKIEEANDILPVEDVQLYEQEGFATLEEWQAELDKVKSEFVGSAENAINTLGDYISEENKTLLTDYENQIMEAESLADIQAIKDQFNAIVDEATKVKEETEAAIAAEQVSYCDNNNYSYNYNYGGNSSYQASNGVLTAWGGVNSYNGYTEKYYNLNMNGVVNNAQAAGIQGDYWVRDDGVKMYGDYVIVASQHHNKGDIIDTSLGTGIVLDYCETPGVVDIATTW